MILEKLQQLYYFTLATVYKLFCTFPRNNVRRNKIRWKNSRKIAEFINTDLNLYEVYKFRPRTSINKTKENRKGRPGISMHGKRM